MLATIASATLLGVDGHARPGRGPRSAGPARLHHRRPARRARAARLATGSGPPLLSSGLSWPNQRVTVNLAPTGVRKAGSGLDLAIAIGVLVADGQLAGAVVAERRLPRRARARRHDPPGPGRAAARRRRSTPIGRRGARRRSAAEAAARRAPRRARRVRRSAELRGLPARASEPWPALPSPDDLAPPDRDRRPTSPTSGASRVARFALEVAAAGGHHLLHDRAARGRARRCWPSGCPACCPPLDRRRGAGDHPRPLRRRARRCRPAGSSRRPPFRAPHHGASPVALVGGGRRPHAARARSRSRTNGVLFLDELAEFHAARARRAAPAARGGRGPGRPGAATRHASRPGSCWSRP